MTDLFDHVVAVQATQQVRDAARRVHPTWLTALGARNAPTEDELCREIAMLLVASEDSDSKVFTGHGIVLVKDVGVEGWTVCVPAADIAKVRLEIEMARAPEICQDPTCPDPQSTHYVGSHK